MPTERIEFTSEGVRIVGDLRIPADSSHEAPGGLPALVFTGPLSGVKDQVVGNYASRLADAGFVTLAFMALAGFITIIVFSLVSFPAANDRNPHQRSELS